MSESVLWVLREFQYLPFQEGIEYSERDLEFKIGVRIRPTYTAITPSGALVLAVEFKFATDEEGLIIPFDQVVNLADLPPFLILSTAVADDVSLKENMGSCVREAVAHFGRLTILNEEDASDIGLQESEVLITLLIDRPGRQPFVTTAQTTRQKLLPYLVG